MIKGFLSHPATVLASMIVGSCFGYFLPERTGALSDFGAVYLNALQMCVLPLVAVAVFTSCISLGKRKANMLGILRRLLFIFVGGMFAVVVIGLAIGLLCSLGEEIDSASQKILGGFVNLAESPNEKFVIRSGFDFLQLIIPHNPFLAFAEGSGLKILFFSIVMGIAFSFGRHEKVTLITDLLGEVFDAFIRVMNFLILLMPFGLFFIFARQFSTMTFEVLAALAKLLIVSILASAALVVLNLCVMKIASGKGLWETCKALSGVLFMSFATQSGFVTMPRMIRDMKDKFRVDENLLKVVIPLGINMSPQGSCLAITLFGVFFANMYQVGLSPGIALILVVGSMMISMAIAGMPAIVGISMIAGLFEVIGVPAAISTIILMAVFPILDPFITVLNCVGNCSYSLLLRGGTAEAFEMNPAISDQAVAR